MQRSTQGRTKLPEERKEHMAKAWANLGPRCSAEWEAQGWPELAGLCTELGEKDTV